MMNAANRISTQTPPILVVGLGQTGWSVVRFLCGRGESVVVTDTREAPPYLEKLKQQFPEVEFIPSLPQSAFSQYREVVTSPGLAVTNGRPVGDIELFLREASAPVIAITGSNGKSTVTELVGHMLRAANLQVLVGGNIGTPALDLLAQPTPEYYVLELSSFQLETTHSLRACSAVVLNICEDHMDRYQGLADYARAKRRIYDNAAAAVINRDDPLTVPIQPILNSVSFGLDKPGENDFGVDEKEGQRFLARGNTLLAPVSKITMRGEQNVSNILAALALVAAAGLEINDAMVQAALRFPGLPHRCEPIGSWYDVSWINDSKGTNVGATLAAIRGASKPLILIAGGQGKGADFTELGKAIRTELKTAILFGEDARQIADATRTGDKVRFAATLDEAVEIAATCAVPGDTVLFSPACASFDMFKSYSQRGDVFRHLVRRRFAGLEDAV